MRLLASAVSSFVAAALLVPATSATAQEPTTHTVVALERAHSDLWADDTPAVHDAAEGDYVVYRTVSAGGVAVRLDGQFGREVVLRPPSGGQFTPGSTYPVAHTPSSTHAMVSDGHTCGAVRSGVLTIIEITRTETNAVTSLAARFALACHDGHLWGELRFASTTPYAVVTRPRSALHYDNVTTGATVTKRLTLTAAGSAPVRFGAASVTGTAADRFAVLADGCADQTVPAGGTCVIDVQFTAGDGASGATLVVPDDTARGDHGVPAYGRGVPPPPAPSVTAVPGVDGVGVTGVVPPQPAGVTITERRLYRDDAGTWTQVASGPASYLVDPQPPGTTATYAMRVVNNLGGESPLSEPVTATVPSGPTPAPGVRNGLSVEFVADRYTGHLPSWGGRTVQLGEHAPGQFTLSSNPGGVSFVAPVGTSFAPGSYAVAPQATATAAAVAVTQCTLQGGQLDVTAAAQRADGTPVLFDASFRLQCAEGVYHGEVRYQGERPFVGSRALPGYVGESLPRPVGTTSAPLATTVTNVGDSELVLGEPVVPPDWRLHATTCAGATLPVDGTCRVEVVFVPTAPGDRGGVVVIPANTASGAVRFGVNGTATSVPSAPALTATGLVGRAFLRWSPPASDGGSRVGGYHIYRGSSPDALTRIGYLALTPGEELTYLDPGGTPGTRRWYAVSAVSDLGEGARSAPVEVVLAARELYYVDDPGNRGYRSLYVRPLDTGAPPAALGDDGRDYAEPTVSPEGNHLAFTRSTRSNPQAHQVMVMHIHHRLPMDDYGSPGHATKLAWSPNGRKLAWSRRDSGATSYATYVGPVFTRDGPTTVYGTKVPNSDGTFSPSWLPNGRELVVVDQSNDLVSVLEADGYYLVPVAGAGPAYEAAVSPDGNLVAWSRFEGEETSGGGEPTPKIGMRISWIGGGAGRTVADTGFNVEPVWSPDSTVLYWERTTRGPDGTWTGLDVYSVPADTATPVTRLTETADADENDMDLREANRRTAPLSAPRPAQDFTGDGKADPAVFRPYNGNWYVRGQATVKFGTRGDVPVAADYNGDRRADRAVFRPSTGTWHVHRFLNVQFGAPGDVPVPADYNGDGRVDIAVYRPSTGMWYVRGGQRYRHGTARHVPVPADYNGDRRADIAVYDPDQRTYVLMTGGVKARVPLMSSETIPTPADFDGNRRAEYVGYDPREGTFMRSDGAEAAVRYSFGDIPACADFTGDRKADLVLFRPVNGMWDVNGVGLVRFGTRGDVPV